MYDLDKARFGVFVAQLRKEQGMTQQALAEKLCISNKAVSKWETGVSLPDVALLLPLAQTLGVTVAELLQGKRMEGPVEAEDVEVLVKHAIQLQASSPVQRRRRIWIYALCVLAASLELVALYAMDLLERLHPECAPLAVIFGITFGAYFMFLAREQLPDFYDSNRLNGMVDGVFRMNIPGVRFHNGNWPHILRCGRIWSMMLLTVYPALTGILGSCCPAFWGRVELVAFLILALGGLFVPILLVGRKYP